MSRMRSWGRGKNKWEIRFSKADVEWMKNAAKKRRMKFERLKKEIETTSAEMVLRLQTANHSIIEGLLANDRVRDSTRRQLAGEPFAKHFTSGFDLESVFDGEKKYSRFSGVVSGVIHNVFSKDQVVAAAENAPDVFHFAKTLSELAKGNYFRQN